MGASVSTNSIKSLVENSIKVINSYEQTCSASATEQGIVINFDGCTVGSGGGIDFENEQFIKQSCMTNANTQVSISASVRQSMKQAAEATVQQFAFGTVADANNFIDLTVKLADEITNTYTNVCSVKGTSNNITFNCKDSTINGLITAKNYQNITQSCILNAVTQSRAFQDTVSKLAQSAVATQQSTFAYILLLFVVILAIGAWFLVSVADNPLVQWLIVGLVLFSVIGTVIYTASAKNAGNYPYKKP